MKGAVNATGTGARRAMRLASTHERTPLRRGGGAVQFVSGSAGEVALVVEVVVDDALHGGERLNVFIPSR